MKNSEFLQQIEESFGAKYNAYQIEALQDVLRFIKASTFEAALKAMLRKYSTLPSVKNVEATCREVQEEIEESQPALVRSASHSYTPQDFGVRSDTFNAWLSELKIEARGSKLFVKVPKLIHQHWIADNHDGLMRSLLRPFNQNGIMDVVFVFVSEAGSRIETEVDVTEFTGVKRPPVELLASGNQSSEVRV